MVGRTVDRGDLGSGLTSFRDKAVPGSHLVCEVRVMSCVGEGVVGIQLVMTGGTRTRELPIRGAAAGESRSTRAHSFAIDAPVERFTRLECEHEGGLIERLRVITSGGRVSPWFGERLTLSPCVVDLPDWRQHSLAATTAAAASTAWIPTRNVPHGSDDFSKERAAEAATAAAASAPPWDPQKEYVTGLVGVRTQSRLVGLGVITRHVTSSHVFSYMWEAADEDEGAGLLKRKQDFDRQQEESSPSDTGNSSRLQSGSGTSPTVGGSSLAKSVNSSCASSGGSLCSGSSSMASGPLATSGSTALDQPQNTSATQPGEMDSSSGICSSGGDTDRPSAATSSSTPCGASLGKALTRAEAKQERFAKEMRDREKKKEERARQVKQKEERMQRLMRGGKARDDEEDGRSTSSSSFREVTSYSGEAGKGHRRGRARGPRAPPTPQEEFASVLRMRRTDARRALERSIALARAARKYQERFLSHGDDGNDNGEVGGALSSLSVIMGLTTWFHEALLPQLVSLPVPALATAELFQRAENALMEARVTKVKGKQMLHAAEGLQEKRQQRPRKGVMSPAQRAREVTEREVSFTHGALRFVMRR